MGNYAKMPCPQARSKAKLQMSSLRSISRTYNRDGSTTKNFTTLRPRQIGRHFPDDILQCILEDENVWISIKISLKFVPKGQINNISALVQIMAYRRPGDKPLSESMTVSLLTNIYVTRSQWVEYHQRQLTLLCYSTINKWVNCMVPMLSKETGCCTIYR